MSAIIGAFRRDGAPIPAGMLEKMVEPIKHRGVDGIHLQYGCGRDANIALGSLKLITTPEMVDEAQPLADETGMVWLVWHGRVDNREELARKLTVRGTYLRDQSDAELVLRSYQMWGNRLVEHIVGPFAFVIWDGRTMQLLCGRDFLGMKPLYYYLDHRWFIWASEIRPILENVFIDRQTNVELIGEFLTNQLQSKRQTLFLNIRKVAPATTLQVDQCSQNERNYWGREQLSRVDYKRRADYVANFDELFTTAVNARLRTASPVAILLSGGIDSSCVAAKSIQITQERNLQTPLEAYTETFENFYADERDYSAKVAEHLNLVTHYIPYRTPTARYFHNQLETTWLPAPIYNTTHMFPLYHAMHKNGVRVVLSGHGGDQWLFGAPYYYADLIRDRAFTEFFDSIRTLAHISSPTYALRFGLRYAVQPFFQHQLSWLKQHLGRQTTLVEAHTSVKIRKIDKKDSNGEPRRSTTTKKGEQNESRDSILPEYRLSRQRTGRRRKYPRAQPSGKALSVRCVRKNV